MPGVSDTGISGLGREKAESIKLWLPSQLDTAERESLCSGSVITSERELRFGQLHDSLNDLRRARQIRYGLVKYHRVQLAGEGGKTQTKSRAVMHTVEERIDRAVRRYRVARSALLQLDPSGGWKDLYLTLEDRDNRGPGKEPKEVTASDGRYVLSWIWLSNPSATAGGPAEGGMISPDEVNEDMRVEWAQCMARADRWEEEVVLLQEEMRRVVHFLEWKSKEWISMAGARAGVISPELHLGLSAYACKQASVFHNLAIRFCQCWHTTLVSLSLSHVWAAKFLETQGAPLVNPDFKKRGSECEEHEPSVSPVTPPHSETPIMNTNAVPPKPANLKISGENGGSSSDSDSYVDSEEFDESEREAYGL